MTELLSHEQTLRLIKLAQSGDEDASEQLITHNTALIKSVLKAYLGRGAEYDDLFQTGAIGLIKAIKGYDESYNVRFSTYAVPMIAGEIKRFLRDDGMIKVSRGIKENAIRIYRAQEKFKREHGKDAHISELAEECGIKPEDVTEALEALKDPVSIYEPAYGTSGDTKTLLIDTVMSETSEESAAIDKLMLAQVLKELSEREKKIILLRFFREKTQSEIAAEIGVSQVQVSRLITKTLQKLRDYADR